MISESSFYLCEKQTEWGHVGVKRIDRVIKDGAVIAETIWRCVLTPGDDLDAALVTLNEKADATEVIAITRLIHTPDVIAAYQASRE